jgi:hypothetical protein
MGCKRMGQGRSTRIRQLKVHLSAGFRRGLSAREMLKITGRQKTLLCQIFGIQEPGIQGKTGG